MSARDNWNFLSKSMVLQLAAEQDIENEEHLKLLFPSLYESRYRRKPIQRHACVQTMPEIDPAQAVWILELEKKAENLCVSLSNFLNSVIHYYNPDKRVGLDFKDRQKAEARGSDLRFKPQFGSKYPVNAASDRQFESTSKKNGLYLENSLKDILNRAKEVRNAIPILSYDAQPKNLKPENQPVTKSLIPVNKRINDLKQKSKMRRSNSVPDFFTAMSFPGEFRNVAKCPNSIEESKKLPTSAAKGFKYQQNIPSANGYCTLCGQYRKSPQENMQGSVRGALPSESASRTGAIPKKQTVMPTRTRTASQSIKTRTVSNRPRWK